jgi:hypothetical protein
MRRTVLLFLVGLASGAACGGGARSAAPPSWLTPAEAGIAPRPFTAAQLREGMPVGTELRYRIEEAGKPVQIMVMRVTASDGTNATMATRMLADDGTLAQDLGTKTSAWEELVKHATFPTDSTTVSEKNVDTPSGPIKGVEYVVRKTDATGAPVVTTYQFVREMPGPPVLLVEEKGGAVTSRMTLVSRT